MSRATLVSSLAVVLFAGATLAATTPAYAGERPGAAEDTSSTGVVLGARLGWSSLIQLDWGPPLCCGERDSWAASGPQVGITAAYELWSWLAVGVQARLARYDHQSDELDGAKRVELVDVQAGPFVDFIIFREPFALSLGLHGGWARLSGEIEDSIDGRSSEIEQTSHPLGLHIGMDWPVGSDVSAGLAASIEVYSGSELRNELGLVVSWAP